jgi:hypothetical protein
VRVSVGVSVLDTVLVSEWLGVWLDDNDAVLETVLVSDKVSDTVPVKEEVGLSDCDIVRLGVGVGGGETVTVCDIENVEDKVLTGVSVGLTESVLEPVSELVSLPPVRDGETDPVCVVVTEGVGGGVMVAVPVGVCDWVMVEENVGVGVGGGVIVVVWVSDGVVVFVSESVLVGVGGGVTVMVGDNDSEDVGEWLSVKERVGGREIDNVPECDAVDDGELDFVGDGL